LKPDLSAPGLDIAAAASPKDKTTIRDAAGNAFALMSGETPRLSVCMAFGWCPRFSRIGSSSSSSGRSRSTAPDAL
jgi:hypothetical protein